MRKLVAAMLAALIIVATPAAALAAGTSSAKDGDDAAGALDLAKATLKAKGGKVVGTLTMHDAFGDEALAAPNTIGVDFMLKRKKVRGIAIRWTDGALAGTICDYAPGDLEGTKCRKVSVDRVGDRSVRFSVKRKLIAPGAAVLKWRAGAADFQGGQCLGIECVDFAPGGVGDFKTWRL